MILGHLLEPHSSLPSLGKRKSCVILGHLIEPHSSLPSLENRKSRMILGHLLYRSLFTPQSVKEEELCQPWRPS